MGQIRQKHDHYKSSSFLFLFFKIFNQYQWVFWCIYLKKKKKKKKTRQNYFLSSLPLISYQTKYTFVHLNYLRKINVNLKPMQVHIFNLKLCLFFIFLFIFPQVKNGIYIIGIKNSREHNQQGRRGWLST